MAVVLVVPTEDTSVFFALAREFPIVRLRYHIPFGQENMLIGSVEQSEHFVWPIPLVVALLVVVLPIPEVVLPLMSFLFIETVCAYPLKMAPSLVQKDIFRINKTGLGLLATEFFQKRSSFIPAPVQS